METGRIVIADSAFSSVENLIALKQRGLMYFMGLVKLDDDILHTCIQRLNFSLKKC